MLKHAPRILAVYIGVGPLIGLVVFALGVSIFGGAPSGSPGLLDHLVSAASVLAIILVFGLLFAHLMGAPWALVAAIAAIAIFGHAQRRGAWIGPASGLVSFAAALTIGSKPTIDRSSVREVSGYLAIHLVAATASWMLARRWIGRAEQRDTGTRPDRPPVPGSAGPDGGA